MKTYSGAEQSGTSYTVKNMIKSAGRGTRQT